MKKYIIFLSLLWLSAEIQSSENNISIPNSSKFEILYNLEFNQDNFFQSKNKLLVEALELEGYRLLVAPTDPTFPYIDLLYKLTKQKMQEYQYAKLRIMQELINELNSFFPINLINHQEVATVLQRKEQLIQYLIETDSYPETRKILKDLIESSKQSIKNFQQLQNLIKNSKK